MTEYKPTIFDVHGPAALDRIRALSYGAMVFGLAFGVMGLEVGFSIWTFVVPLLAGGATARAAFFLGTAVGNGWTRFAVSGASTPYEEQFSYQQSLVMQGKV